MEHTQTIRDTLRQTYRLVEGKQFDPLTSEFIRKLEHAQKQAKSCEQRNRKHYYESLAQIFQELTNAFPKIMHHWFTTRWPNCEHWFQVRLLYTTSLAVWSVVCFFLGLGNFHIISVV